MKTIIPILLSLSLSAQLPDDVKHVYSTMAVTVLSAEIMNQVIDNRTISLCSGMALGIGVGLAKEYVYDKAMGRGVFSSRDIMSDGWGVLLGGIVIGVRFNLQIDKNKHGRNTNYRASFE